MSADAVTTSAEVTQAKALRRLFLMLFLRGRSSRGLNRKNAPRSVGSKLALVLTMYALMGCMAANFLRQPVFVLSLYMNALTIIFLGMYITASAGEVLFNKEEADILLHRPVSAGALLWAKIRVLIEVSLWMGTALNLAGLFVGMWAVNGDWRYPLVHLLSTVLETVWCTGSVVIMYQLCLKWFGRERLDSLMTATQIVVSIGLVLGGQVLPQMAFHMHHLQFAANNWWIALFPPAWFAGLDDALAGSSAAGSWVLAGLAVGITALVIWMAFSKLAKDYERGMQIIHEGTATRRRVKARAGRRWIEVLADLPPWRWWLRDPAARASFLLTVTYLVRDRDVKLRLYPGIAPMLVVPFIFLLRDTGPAAGGFGTTFSGGYVGLVPLMALTLLQYSQQWQASDIFRVAPISGPGPLCNGARVAVLSFLTLPVLLVFASVTWFMHGNGSQWPMLLPGIIALPIYALMANLGGKGVPLSVATEEAKSAGRGLMMFGVVMIAMVLSGLATWAWMMGWFWWFVAGEGVVAAGLYGVLRRSITRARWPAID